MLNKLLQDIMQEIRYCLILSMIIIIGTLSCIPANKEALWQERYQNWEYNLNPQEGSGWIDAAVKPNHRYQD